MNDIKVNENDLKKNNIYMLFSIHDFGICKKVDLGKQTNGAGKIFMRSEHDAIETSK